MKITTMWSVLIAIFLTMLDAALCNTTHTEFQCGFDSDNFHIQQATHNAYLYGSDDVKPYVFENRAELDDMIMKIDIARAEVFKNYLYNDIDNFVEGFIAKYMLNKSQEAFIDEYNPSNVESTGYPSQNQLGMLVRTFRNIYSKPGLKKLKDHCFIAVSTEELSEEEKEKLVTMHDGPTTFNNEDLQGLIKIRMDDQEGYIIINMQYPMYPSPNYLEMDGTPDEATLNKIAPKSFEKKMKYKPVTFRLLGKDNKYIEILKYHYNHNTDKLEVKESSLVFTRPLCSFNQIQNKMDFRNNIFRTMYKFSRNFYLQAYVHAWVVKPESEEAFVTIGYPSEKKVGSKTVVVKNEVYIDEPVDLFAKTAQAIIGEVANRMELAKPSLRSKLMRFLRVALRIKQLNKNNRKIKN